MWSKRVSFQQMQSMVDYLSFNEWLYMIAHTGNNNYTPCIWKNLGKKWWEIMQNWMGEEGMCFSFLSVVVIKTKTKSNLKRKEFILPPMQQCIILGTQGKKSRLESGCINRSRAWRNAALLILTRNHMINVTNIVSIWQNILLCPWN